MVGSLSFDLLRGAASPATGDQTARLKETAAEFEALFLGMFLKQMRASARAFTEQKTSEQKISLARDTYEGWQDDLLSRSLSAAGGIGLSQVLYRQLQQQQIAKAQGNLPNEAE